MHFTKMNGLGNDYIFIDGTKKEINLDKERIIRLCDRNFGIGGDGIIVVKLCEKADFAMKIYNADGSEAEMCGNALRCLVKFVRSNRLTDKTNLTVSTKAGIKQVLLRKDGLVEANMGMAMISHPSLIFGQKGYLVRVGNPHYVVPVKSNLDKRFDRNARRIAEDEKRFPNGVNVEYVAYDKEGNYATMRVWERGTGETLSCGTGASAVFGIGCYLGFLQDNATIMLRGGKLAFRHNDKNEIIVIGNAEINYKGKTNE